MTVVFGRLGIVAPPEHVRKPMAPSRLCDLLAPGGAAKVFFATELSGSNSNSSSNNGDPLDAARAALAEGGDLAFTVAGKDELSYVAKYVDGKQCLVMQRDTASERAGAAAVATASDGSSSGGGGGGGGGGAALVGVEPSLAVVEAELAALAKRPENGSKAPRDPFLRSDALARRVADMSVDAAAGVVGRITVPPAPTDSKDIRKFGAKCLESQVGGGSSRGFYYLPFFSFFPFFFFFFLKIAAFELRFVKWQRCLLLTFLPAPASCLRVCVLAFRTRSLFVSCRVLTRPTNG